MKLFCSVLQLVTVL